MLKTSVSTQTDEEESRGPWNATGPSQEPAELLGTGALFICPDLRFTPRILDLRPERSPCPEGICCKYETSREGDADSPQDPSAGEF